MRTTWLILIALFFMNSAKSQTKKIVFVCEHGSAKSVIAATYFNKFAKEKNLPWEAVARGTNPDQEISAKTKQLLIKDNLLDKSFVPQKISQEDVDGADQVVLFYNLPETVQGKNNMQYWLEINAVNNDFEKLRNDIVEKITPMIDSLTKR